MTAGGGDPPGTRAGETVEARTARWLRNYRDEVDGAELYRLLAEHEPDPSLSAIYARLAEQEAGHADVWRRKLLADGTEVLARSSLRLRVLRWLARRFGPRLVLPAVRMLEVRGEHGYAGQPEPEAAGMQRDERSHARTFAALADAGGGPSTIPRLEGRHRGGSGNTLRAGVLGANDGLVSNLALVMGVAGADPGRDVVLLAGLTGLLAGGLSMALGEWISVRSSREALERQIGIEADELQEFPEEERAELALIYRAKGLPAEEANRLAQRLVADPAVALDTLVREELGLDPGELGSAARAALSSFVLFVAGAVVPVLPFLALDGWPAVLASAATSGAALFALGAAITLFTGRSAFASGLRQLWVGLAAAAVTFGLGTLLGVATGL